MSTATSSQPASIWNMKVAEGGGGDFTPCPPGNIPGKIVGLFDIGHQPETKTDNKTGVVSNVLVRKMAIVFELTKKQPNGQPHVMGLKYTWSMNEQANFYKLVVNVTGQSFASGQSFDPTVLLGMPVMVNVVHAPGAQGKVYANVKTVTAFPDGFPAPETVYTPILWSVLDGTPFPAHAEPWLPYLYGKTIPALVSESSEMRGGVMAPPATANADGSLPTVQPKGTPPDLVPILAKCPGLVYPYMADDAKKYAHRLTAEEFDTLDSQAIHF